ncbi:M23 family metallopeptidase [Cryobacterium luteum]|uniref:M23 family metallopeptidase n=1 Tax=Cryobacterium luteum TaxID=1424661 RepID=A0A1H8LPM6_9MICO|nr:M23 family metallopeptidase [Cryobacterium luteum]TFB89946.1 M23 family metallopeptidase [Cryobacterium luteum]SEO07085.1 Peptidase family M23 [Cryobacterium luteum]
MAAEKGKSALILIGAPVALIGTFFLLIILVFSGTAATAACTNAAGTVNPDTVPTDPIAGYSGEQLKNAAYIMNAASTLALDRTAQVVGVMTAMGESSLLNVGFGDDLKGVTNPDGTPTCSLGLFQQQWCLGSWGTRDEVLDPAHAATAFFDRLVGVADWQSLAPTLAIHKVQGNADPYHYEIFFDAADQIVTALAGDGATGGGCTSGTIAMPLSPGFNMTDDYGPRRSPVPGASSWHPASDLQNYPNPCGDPIYAITSGTVTLIEGYQVSIKSPDGYTVSYLHMKLSDVSVQVGDAVMPGQPIALVGNEGPSTGCHLDLRINTVGSTNDAVNTLPAGEDLGGPPASAGFVNPEEYFTLFGVELCPAGSCQRQDS